jgi:hypothetical protein
MNKRLDAPHVRLYRWMLDSPAYLSLTCPARAVLIEIARGHDGTNKRQAGTFDSSSVGTVQHRARYRSTSLCRVAGARLYRLHDEGNIQQEGAARDRVASDVVGLRRNRGIAEQKNSRVGAAKNKTRYQNIPSRYQIRASTRHKTTSKQPHDASD